MCPMNWKRIFSILMMSLILMLTGLTALYAQSASPLLWLEAETGQVTAGQEFAVNVYVSEAVGVYGGSFKLSYDPQALEVVLTDSRAVAPGTFFGGQSGFTLKNSADAQTGVIEYALTLTQPAEPVSGQGQIGTVVFRALRDTPVIVEALEARLLSPEFVEVNGRRIARQINEVETRLQGFSLAAASTTVSEPVSVPQQPEAQPQVAAPSSPAPLRMSNMVSFNRTSVMIGGLLFMIGLGLFVMSIGVYISLRRDYTTYRRNMERPVW